ncbi:MAG TPA: glycosyltransferase family 39 protein [Solirubrobacterales bacterium]|nr:glycosyltransferase family 39 protein [Solirubrobacterales bacterium]
MTAVTAWFRALPERYGRRTLIALAAIALLGLVARAYVVVNPVVNPADDSHAYYALSKALYEEGSFGGPEFHDSSDWSPGAPFLYAAAFYATGGAREGTARIVEALLGVASILVIFALGKRLGDLTDERRRLGSAVGLFAAFAVAVYPPFLHTTGELMCEPPAMLTLPAAILAWLWAGEREQTWPWLVPGVLFGLTAMFRPEYLLVGAAFVALAAIRVWRASDWRLGLAGAAVLLVALVLPILPWTIRNIVVLERVVPISTGGGKALYVGTYLPADGEYQRVKALLVKRYEHRELDPNSEALNKINPTPLFDEVAERYPDLPRDSALGKIGKQNFSKYFGEDPLGYLAMTARKVGRMWSSGVGEAMDTTAGRIVQLLLVFAGLAGLALLALRRRWWEFLAMATPIVLVTLVGAATLAAPRRNEVLMTLIFPLAGLALASAFQGGLGGTRARAWRRRTLRGAASSVGQIALLFGLPASLPRLVRRSPVTCPNSPNPS